MKTLFFSILLSFSLIQSVYAHPDTGWWWNEDEPGRGFSIERQGDTIFFAAYLYDDSGNPTWFIAVLQRVSENRYEGVLEQRAGGQTLTGPFQPANVSNANAGDIVLDFPEHDKGTMTWPGGTVNITRFEFAEESPDDHEDDEPDQDAIARGSNLFQLNCSDSSCHSSEPQNNQNNILSGRDPNAIRSAFTRVQRMINAGVPDRVSDSEVEDIAAFLNSIQ